MAKSFGEVHFINKASSNRDYSVCRYDSEGNIIVAGSSDGRIHVFESQTLEPVHILSDVPEDLYQLDTFAPITSISTFPPRQAKYGLWCLATHSTGFVKLWNIEAAKCLTTIDEGRQILGITISPTLPNFATVGDDATIYMYDEETMSVMQTHKSSEITARSNGHSGRIFTLIFHPKNHNEFLTGGWDNTVQFWDIRKPNSVRSLSGPHINGDGIDIRPNGREILTCSYQKENPLQKWDYPTGKLLINYDMDLFRSMLYCGRWLDMDFIATGGSDPTLFRVASTKTLRTIGYYRSQQTGVYSMDFTSLTKSNSFIDEGPSNITNEPENSTTIKRSKEVDENDLKEEQKMLLKQGTRRDDGENESSTMVRAAFCTGRFIIEVEANLVAR